MCAVGSVTRLIIFLYFLESKINVGNDIIINRHMNFWIECIININISGLSYNTHANHTWIDRRSTYKTGPILDYHLISSYRHKKQTACKLSSLSRQPQEHLIFFFFIN